MVADPSKSPKHRLFLASPPPPHVTSSPWKILLPVFTVDARAADPDQHLIFWRCIQITDIYRLDQVVEESDMGLFLTEATGCRICCKTQKEPAKCLYSVCILYTVYSFPPCGWNLSQVRRQSVSTWQQFRVGQIVWFGCLSAISQLASGSVADPDPHVFGPPGSGYGSFYHHAKIVKKTLIPTILWLFLTFIFEKWCKCSFKK